MIRYNFLLALLDWTLLLVTSQRCSGLEGTSALSLTGKTRGTQTHSHWSLSITRRKPISDCHSRLG